MGCNTMYKDVNICFSVVLLMGQVCKTRKGRVGGRMFRFVEKKRPLDKFFMVVCIALVLAVFSSNIRIQAAEYSASLSTDRASGVCTYTVTGIDINVIQEMTLKVTYNDNNVTEQDNGGNSSTDGTTDNAGAGGAVGIRKAASTNAPANTNIPASTNAPVSTNTPAGTDAPASTNTPAGTDTPASTNTPASTSTPAGTDNKVTALEQKIILDASNCINGTYTGSFSMEDLEKYLFKEYNVSFIMGAVAESTQNIVVDAGVCDFSIHNDAYKIKVTGNRYDINRTFDFMPQTEDASAVPGTGNKVRLVIGKDKTDISKAVMCGVERELANTSKTWETDLSTICSSYGKYYAAVVLENKYIERNSVILASEEFQVALVYSNVGSKKSASLEKKKSFRVFVGSLNSALGIGKVKFSIFNKDNKLVCEKTASRKSGTAYYYADITLKSVGYNLEAYTVKATVTDNAGNKRVLSKAGKVDLKVKKGRIDIQKKTNSTCKFKLSGAYIPGNIKNVKFNVYSVKNGKKTFFKKYFGVYTKDEDVYIADMAYSEKGNYIVYAYGTTQWGKSILLSQKSFKIKKSELGKNGWIYETYAGREYKFYYKNNKLVTDLTEILGLKKTGNKLYLEINRAAGCVTAYAYDRERSAYIIPVKSFTVSVGRDVTSTGTAASLNKDTSYTPLGSYSVSSNGIATKYTLKTMNEPDGSVVYARWATHIVGNVYFHAIAVGSQSHYALSPSTYNRLGSPASAGCIRMTVADAKWIYDYASAGSEVNIVKGNSAKPGPLGKNPIIRVDYTINYDPTDPEVPTSRKKADYSAGHISGYMTKDGKKVGY